MGLTYQQLLSKIDAVLDAKLSDKFRELNTELQDLRKTNTDLLNLNKALIAEIKVIRTTTSHAAAADDDGVRDQVCDFPATEAADIDTADAPCHLWSPQKTYFEVLILSDSIYRHVGSVCPKEQDVRGRPILSNFEVGGISVMKAVYPGACCEHLLSLAAELNLKHCFGHVVVHVGTNYTRQFDPPVPFAVATDICNFLGAIADFLDCKVSYSCMLPQLNLNVINYINFVNSEVDVFCGNNGFGFLQSRRFKRVRGMLDTSLFARDGVHLSFLGAAALFVDFREHIMHINKYCNL